ncbi:hypothetical protein [Salinibaculum salinum]|uniref:hypothetical protein n=1 Tax=Salinibaculum salinum TaxID=3131996 RepID=UPI0030EDA410
MHCSSCGADLPDRALRCPECETPVADAGDDDQSETEQSQPPGQPDQHQSQSDNQQSDQHQSDPQQSQHDQWNPQSATETQPDSQSSPTQSPADTGRNWSRPHAQDQSAQQPSQSGRQTAGQPAKRSPDQSAPSGQNRANQQSQSQSPQQPQGQPEQQTHGQPPQQAQSQPGQPVQGQPHQQRGGRSLGDRLGSAPVVGGLFYGIVAFVVNFFVTAMLVVAAAGEGDLDGYIGGVGNQGPGLLEVFGWFFYSAHNVGITAIGGSQSSSENFIEVFYSFATNPSVPKIAVYLAPAAVLFVLALVLASRTSLDGDATRLDGAVAGGSIMVGYAVLTLVGATVLFTYTTPGGQATVQPVLGSSIVFMCLLYPVASGGIAGYLVGR